MNEKITLEQLTAAKEFRGPIRFADGRNGMAQQDFESITIPRFGYAWRRENRKDKGVTFYLVDGLRVETLEEAAERLNAPPREDSLTVLAEQIHREHDRAKVGARSVENVAARCAETGPFAGVYAAMHRSSHAWHVGVNAYSEAERKAKKDWPRWAYNSKSAAHEAYRLMYLWAADRDRDTGLKCVLGVACRDCPALKNIENAMVSARADRVIAPDPANEFFPEGHTWPGADVWDQDIDMAKTWTCIAHVLQAAPDHYWEGILSTEADRKDDRMW